MPFQSDPQDHLGWPPVLFTQRETAALAQPIFSISSPAPVEGFRSEGRATRSSAARPRGSRLTLFLFTHVENCFFAPYLSLNSLCLLLLDYFLLAKADGADNDFTANLGC
ncbi:hypothetical protein CEXT_534471 [Caerostris extrusa]|uniref:Uncharacterized protein n=1 Tax=Caerostris extrusa TaxID=172846 RepID=A0AAV4XYV1_CAEEX|nr:hypothetical protein CEXT_534471 [Caerostris extrusa]